MSGVAYADRSPGSCLLAVGDATAQGCVLKLHASTADQVLHVRHNEASACHAYVLPRQAVGLQLVLAILDANVKEGSAVHEKGHVLVLGWVVNRKDEEVIWKILSQASLTVFLPEAPLLGSTARRQLDVLHTASLQEPQAPCTAGWSEDRGRGGHVDAHTAAPS